MHIRFFFFTNSFRYLLYTLDDKLWGLLSKGGFSPKNLICPLEKKVYHLWGGGAYFPDYTVSYMAYILFSLNLYALSYKYYIPVLK